MFQFIAAILLIYFVWILVRPFVYRYIQRKYKERLRDMFGQAFGGTYSAPGGSSGRSTQHSAPKKKSKVYARDEGEYVEFEEIEVKVEYSETTVKEEGYSPMEPQVSDADWEEI